jgi:hypothetical protein
MDTRNVMKSGLLYLVISFVPLVNSYCWEIGRNPGFNGTPKVEQVDIQTVNVTWNGIATQTKCADQFLVKYWESTSSLDYHLSDQVNNDVFSIIISVTPKVKYVFEVIAREDKGAIGGIDWNRAKKVEFKTSNFKKRNVEGTPKVEPRSFNQIKKAGLPFNIGLVCIIIVCGVVAVLIAITIIYKLTCYKKSKFKNSKDFEDFEEYDEDEDEDVEETIHGKQKYERCNTTSTCV